MDSQRETSNFFTAYSHYSSGFYPALASDQLILRSKHEWIFFPNLYAFLMDFHLEINYLMQLFVNILLFNILYFPNWEKKVFLMANSFGRHIIIHFSPQFLWMELRWQWIRAESAFEHFKMCSILFVSCMMNNVMVHTHCIHHFVVFPAELKIFSCIISIFFSVSGADILAWMSV